MPTLIDASAAARRPPTGDYFDLVRRFPLVPIRDDAHLAAAHAMLDELSILPEPALTAGQAAYLSVLCDLAGAYEGPVLDEMLRETTGVDLLRLMMDEHGLSAEDVGRIVGDGDCGPAIVRGEAAAYRRTGLRSSATASASRAVRSSTDRRQLP